MARRDFAWFEAELGRRLADIQKRNQAFTMENVIRELDGELICQLSDEALVFAAERFSRHGRQPWQDARARLLAEAARRKIGRERKILLVAIATLLVAAFGVIVTFATA